MLGGSVKMRLVAFGAPCARLTPGLAPCLLSEILMKTAYELAMERLSKTAPEVKLTPEQKKELAELESRCAAKIAEREVLLEGELAKAQASGDAEAIEQLQKQLASDRKSLRAEFEAKKEQVRQRPVR